MGFSRSDIFIRFVKCRWLRKYFDYSRYLTPIWVLNFSHPLVRSSRLTLSIYICSDLSGLPISSSSLSCQICCDCFPRESRRSTKEEQEPLRVACAHSHAHRGGQVRAAQTAARPIARIEVSFTPVPTHLSTQNLYILYIIACLQYHAGSRERKTAQNQTDCSG